MNWKEKCFSALKEADLFEDSGHRTRFKELMDCFCSQPFFTGGLCKCMYLSAWDEGHFCILLETLTQMSLGNDTSLEEMRFNGDVLAKAQQDAQYYVYLLANAFLDGTDFVLEPENEIPEDIRHIITQALAAARVIDACGAPPQAG